jgi:cytochrome P450
VRISPHEVDISDAPACQRVIHSVKGGFLKSPFYSLLITDSSSVFNEIRPEVHRKYKRLLSNPMSETGLKAFLPRIDGKVRLAIERIHEENKTRGAADVAKWFMFLSFDVIGDLTFGEGFGQLESGQVSSNHVFGQVWRVCTYVIRRLTGDRKTNLSTTLSAWVL